MTAIVAGRRADVHGIWWIADPAMRVRAPGLTTVVGKPPAVAGIPTTVA
ncbi:MAG: hypothetical protein AB1736_15465 [Chloroflexota bacterium]